MRRMLAGFIAVGTLLVAAGVWVGIQFAWGSGAALIAGGGVMAALGLAGHRQNRALEAQEQARRPLLNPLGEPPPAPAYEDADSDEQHGTLLELYGGDQPDPGALERSFPPRRRPYRVHTDGLTVVTDTGRLVIPWKAVRVVWHRQEITIPGPTLPGVGARTLLAFCELGLEGTEERLTLAGSPRQEELSALIVDRTRERIIRRIREIFDREGKVSIGELTLTREGIYDGDGGHLPWSGDWRIGGLPFPKDKGGGLCYNTVYVHSADGRTLAAQVPELTAATVVLKELSGSGTS
ncbi:hypothetical protein ACIRQP_18555 [Streptomyces sp. NPDC102274]|uniref:hypothetical protein n=1 Tax=Streptomyces sp. NPDC102274 TaxID=3366151 RepID=UPI0037F4F607